MTRDAVLEYARAVSPRYRKAGKREKGLILDEFCKATLHHRKSAVRLLRSPPEKARGVGVDGGKRRGRPKEYGREVVGALRQVWEASDHLCSKRLAPFLPELVDALERHGELALSDEVRGQLLAVSASTMDRVLKPYRLLSANLKRPYTTRRSTGELKALIPIRTFGEWVEAKPGQVQVDLVAHCGESTEGFYLNSLVAVDVATSWSDFEIVWGKGKERVGTAVHKARQNMPFRLEEIHTDNGSEFINDLLYPWTRAEGLRFTRGRAYKKNDQAYVEQKNWSVVRRLVGYDRYSSKVAYGELGELYRSVRHYVNYFQPVTKLIEKTRDGAKVKKKYDEAKTPYQRVLASGVLAGDEHQAKREELEATYQRLNPVKLRRRIENSLEALWKLTDRGLTERKVAERQQKGKQTERGHEAGPSERPVVATAGETAKGAAVEPAKEQVACG